MLILAIPAMGGVLDDELNEDESADYAGLPKLRLSLEAGFSRWQYNHDTVTSDYKDYLNDVQNAWNYSAELAYFPWPKGGIGVNWIWFLSKAQGRDILPYRNSTISHDLKERVSFVYIGPTFLTRMHTGRFGLLVAGVGAGWLTVRRTWTDNGVGNLLEAANYAVTANLGWDYSIYRFLGVGINGRFILCNVREYTYNGKRITIVQPEAAYHWSNMPLHRFELNAGVRFGL